MIRLILVLALSAVASVAQAKAKKGTCDVQTLRDAERCMEKVAKSRPRFEEPNDGYATADVERLARALDFLGLKPANVNRAKTADFAGVMVEANDERHLYYFAIRKGKDVAPVQLYDLNVVDFDFILDKPYSVEALNPSTYTLGISELNKSGAFEDIADSLKNLSDN